MKKKYVYVLSVDFEGGDGADCFPIRDTAAWKKDQAHIDRHFTSLLFASYPPPKVEIKRLTQKQWAKAQQVGKERA